MIQELTQKNLLAFVKAAAGDDFIGLRVLSALRSYGKDSPVCRFYVVDGQCALMVLGGGALLCGVATDVAELEQFLQLQEVTRFQANLTALYHWGIVPRLLLRYTGLASKPLVPLQSACTLQDAPSLWALAQSGLFPTGIAKDWYADACLRVNKGEADIRAIAENGQWVATAGVYSRDERSAYITAVETQKNYRGKGYASHLLRALCHAHQEKSIYLVCAPDLRKFYEAQGFALVRPLCEFTALEKPTL